MASQGGTSRLAQMQMRFQQKQQEEREQRRIEMTSATKLTATVNDGSSSLNSSFGRGKVRQMFDERRRGTGIDKSYPLKPITNVRSTSGDNTASSKSTTRHTNTTTKTTVKPHQSTVQMHKTITTDPYGVDRNLKNDYDDIDDANNNLKSSTVTILGTTYHENEPFNDDNYNDNELFPIHYQKNGSKSSDNTDCFGSSTYSTKFSNVGSFPSISFDDKTSLNANFVLNRELPEQILTKKKLKPIVIKKTPSTSQKKTTTCTVKSAQITQKPLKTNSTSQENKNSINKMATAVSVNIQSQGREMGVLPDNMVPCKVCNRNFNKDRVEKHQQICVKATKPRKVFDAAKHRIKGTEAEMYTRRPSKTTARAINGTATTVPMRSSSATTKSVNTGKSKESTATAKEPAKKDSNWRKKHEEFIAAIRAAKEVQKHLARGGKLSDLPPPPPSENADYIQCPHCNRRFNETAANRHIPKCATMLHNKPKPAQPKKRF